MRKKKKILKFKLGDYITWEEELAGTPLSLSQPQRVIGKSPEGDAIIDCNYWIVPDWITSIENPPFLLVDIDNNYLIKYDGYRDKNHWTLLRKNGNRILDGDFYDIIAYIVGFQKEEILDR